MDCKEGRFFFPECLRIKMDDNTFLQYLKNSLLCMVGKPYGQNNTYHTLVIDCSYQNKDHNVTDHCRDLAKDCLDNKSFEEATIEILQNLPMKHKERLQKLYEISFSSLEEEPKMKILIKQCTTKFGVDPQWFWNPQIPGPCERFFNVSK